MRGLVKVLQAALLLPALTTAVAVAADVEVDEHWDDGAHEDLADQWLSTQTIDLALPSGDYGFSSLSFVLDVLPSNEACGYGNVTLNGKPLPQTLDRELPLGEGAVLADGVSVAASWSFRCIKVNGQPDSQLLKFLVNSVDGQEVQDVGFSALFKQSSHPEIIKVDFDLSKPDEILANPNPQWLRPAGEDDSFPEYDVEDDIIELEELREQLADIQQRIAAKEQAIAHHASKFFHEKIKECDSLKCVATLVAARARHAAHNLYGKLRGEGRFHRGHDHFPRPHWPKPVDSTCGHLKHGKGNPTSPHPPFRKPHFPPPPPPPPFHHGKPPGEPDAPDVPDHGPPPPPHHKPDKIPPPPPHHDFQHDQGPIVDPNLDAEPGNRHHHGPPPPIHRAFHAVELAAIGSLLALLLFALHRRMNSNPRKKQDRGTRREERRRRRALRRAAHKHAISRWLARFALVSDDASGDYEEKREDLMEDAEEGMSTTMSDDLSEFRNAADMVSDMVAHAQTSAVVPLASTHVHHVSSMRDYEMGSQVGDEEQLPAYEEDNEGSEFSSVVADGMRYTPGSTEYTPSHSSSGSLSDILGPDMKQ